MMAIGFAQADDVKGDKYKPVDNKYTHIADAFRYGIVKRRQLRVGSEVPRQRPEYKTAVLVRRDHPDTPDGMYISHAELAAANMDEFNLSAYYGFGDGAYDRWH